MIKLTRGERIFGFMNLFVLVTVFVLGSWRYVGLAVWMAAITGAFVGEAWHRWRTGQKNGSS